LTTFAKALSTNRIAQHILQKAGINVQVVIPKDAVFMRTKNNWRKVMVFFLSIFKVWQAYKETLLDYGVH
jgi:hypothetical protein